MAQASIYRSLNAGISAGFDYLLSTDLVALPTGQPLIDCRFEAHRRYIDIQCMVRGVEQIGVTALSNVALTDEYSPERDIAFYQGVGDFITLRKGSFAIFYPHDAHQPGIAMGVPQTVRKVVIKVALEW